MKRSETHSRVKEPPLRLLHAQAQYAGGGGPLIHKRRVYGKSHLSTKQGARLTGL
jgi:hypothetical protein